jgi:hypothetical protein
MLQESEEYDAEGVPREEVSMEEEEEEEEMEVGILERGKNQMLEKGGEEEMS